MKNLDSKLLNEFLEIAGQHLTGDWLLVGGTLLPAVGIDSRATVDIDFVGLTASERSQTLEVMDIAEKLSLPIETINQAAAYFVDKVSPKKADMIILKKGKRANIFRPSCEFYLKLKCERLSQSDLQDCMMYYEFCKKNGDKIDGASIKKHLNAVSKQQTGEKLKRLKQLLNSL
jgi:hypothetical protein